MKLYLFQNGPSSQYVDHNPDQEVEDLHPADDREAREEPHGASDSGELVHKLGCSVLKRKYFDPNGLHLIIKFPLEILSKVEVRIEIWTYFSLLLNLRSAEHK